MMLSIRFWNIMICFSEIRFLTMEGRTC